MSSAKIYSVGSITETYSSLAKTTWAHFTHFPRNFSVATF